MVDDLRVSRQCAAFYDGPSNADGCGLFEYHRNDLVLSSDVGQNPDLRHHPAFLAKDGGLDNVEHATKRPQIVDCLGEIFSRLIVYFAFEDRDTLSV